MAGIQQEAATAAAKLKSFASRKPPQQPGARKAWDDLVLGYCTQRFEDRRLGRKCKVTQADWWKTYAFSDSFHPTPYGHQLVSQLVSRSLARAGWL